MPAATITALNVYPVKGCRGIGLARAAVTVRGLVVPACGHGDGHGPGDREWMIVDGAGRFVTQREHPRLALIETALDGDALRLSSSCLPPLGIPLTPAAGVTREVVVWRSSVPAHDAGAVAADWLSAFLGVEVRLVRFDPAHERRCNPDYAGASGAHTAFADGYPVLVIGEASLADLNARLAARAAPALPMNRFRPNVVLGGLDAYDEDHLDTIAADGVVLKLVKPCTRCQVTTIDQDRATRSSEPLATLAGYRNDVTQGGVKFGMNAIVVAGAGGELTAGTSAMCTYRF